MQRCNYHHMSQWFKKYINTNYCDKNVLVLVGAHRRFGQQFTNQEELPRCVLHSKPPLHWF